MKKKFQNDECEVTVEGDLTNEDRPRIKIKAKGNCDKININDLK